uniref:Movement protein TGBp3 n=1 Tax=Shallot latent virus TaxID=12172 RepID=A0A6M2VKP2_9VIRU|nr:triple gene block 3 protein [Shallot latent virus]
MQVQPLVVLVTSLIITLLFCYSFEGLRNEKCTVIITGESVKIIGCDFTKEFIDFAKQAKPFGSL